MVVFDSVAGVQSQSETVWRQADHYGVPRIAFMNKMDRIGADFSAAVQSMRDRLNAVAFPIQLPIGAEDGFLGVVDLITMKALIWNDEQGLDMSEGEIPAGLQEPSVAAHNELVEFCADFNDELMGKYLEGEESSPGIVRRALRKATLQGQIVPVLCGSAIKNKGVQPLLNAVIDYLPSPLDVLPVLNHNDPQNERHADPDEPMSALIFKIQSDPNVGKLSYIRVYSGRMSKGTKVLNTTSGNSERIGRILQMHANHREDREEVSAGDIVAVVGLKSGKTGDTICDPAHPIVLEQIEFPNPVIAISIKPKTKINQAKLGEALARLAEEDPTFQVNRNEETNQTLISGMGELHLKVIIERLLEEFKVEANIGEPQVAYRETITKPVMNVNSMFKRQTGGRGQYGHAVLNVEPVPCIGFRVR